MTPSEQIKLVMEYVSETNISQFCRGIEVERYLVSDVLSNKVKTISQNLASAIVKKYPQISISWLICQSGEMIEDGANPINQSNDHANVYGGNFSPAAKIDNKKGTYGDEQNTSLDILKEQIDTLNECVRSLNKSNSDLIAMLADATKERQQLLAIIQQKG